MFLDKGPEDHISFARLVISTSDMHLWSRHDRSVVCPWIQPLAGGWGQAGKGSGSRGSFQAVCVLVRCGPVGQEQVKQRGPGSHLLQASGPVACQGHFLCPVAFSVSLLCRLKPTLAVQFGDCYVFALTSRSTGNANWCWCCNTAVKPHHSHVSHNLQNTHFEKVLPAGLEPATYGS